MDLCLDAPIHKRLEGIRALGAQQIRPLGLEADRLGRPTPPEHNFFGLLVSAGQGRTRWSGSEDEGDANAGSAAARVGNSRDLLCLAEEMSYWDRGVAVSFPGPGLGEPPLLSMGTLDQKRRFLTPFIAPDRPRWACLARS